MVQRFSTPHRKKLEASPPSNMRLLGIVGIGVIQAGLSLYLSWQQIGEISQNPQSYSRWVLPFEIVSIGIAIVAVIALYLIVRHRRIGLKLGLGTWAVSSVLTLFYVLNVNAPFAAMRNYFFLNAGISLFVNLVVMYAFAHYLSQPPGKSAFIE